jgi:hypothetical protein
MALPSGQISFNDFATEQGLLTGAQSNLNLAATIYGVGFATDGSNVLGMDEFQGLSAPMYDVYEGVGAGGIEFYYVLFSSSNPYQSTISGNCATKETGPPGLNLGGVLNLHPTAVESAVGPDCGGGGFDEP